MLLRRIAVDQPADGPQPVGAVGQGDLAGAFDGVDGMTMGQAQQPLQHAHALDAAGLQQASAHAVHMRSNQANLPNSPGRAAFDAADLLGDDVLATAC